MRQASNLERFPTAARANSWSTLSESALATLPCGRLWPNTLRALPTRQASCRARLPCAGSTDCLHPAPPIRSGFCRSASAEAFGRKRAFAGPVSITRPRYPRWRHSYPGWCACKRDVNYPRERCPTNLHLLGRNTRKPIIEMPHPRAKAHRKCRGRCARYWRGERPWRTSARWKRKFKAQASANKPEGRWNEGCGSGCRSQA